MCLPDILHRRAASLSSSSWLRSYRHWYEPLQLNLLSPRKLLPSTPLQQRIYARLQDCLASSMCQGQAPPRRQPTASPPFTIGTLRKAIPPHCFDRSLLRSSAYLGADLAAVAVLYLCTTLFSHPAVPSLVRWGVLWPAYWVLQGAVCTGLWVIAHECGHQVRELFAEPSSVACYTAIDDRS
jgi:hypothetical protein